MKKIALYIFCFLSFVSWVFAQESSILVTQATQIAKSHGFQNSIFVHETYFVNPFSEYQIIVEKNEDIILWYRVWWKIFDENHFLYIQESDTEDIKTLKWWHEIQDGIYKKQILQESTYEVVDGVITPNQTVAATSYYRVVYNHDTTPWKCVWSIFSHDSSGMRNFDISKNTWFNSEKYAYFACHDQESGCYCDASDTTCFIQNQQVFSVPQTITHNNLATSTFYNHVWLESSCNSWDKPKVFYDTLSPDMNLLINDSVIDTSASREYISNDGVLYDGQQIPEKRFYNLKNNISLKADTDTKMHFELFDMYDASKTGEWVSGIQSYSVAVSKNIDGIWSQLWKININNQEYNIDGTKTQSDTQQIIGEDISFLKNTFTKVWDYQVYISFQDAAGNSSRVVLYYTIIPHSLDAWKSFAQTLKRESVYADNESFYSYDIYLRDAYDNPIVEKQVYNLEHSCEGISGCKTLRQNMLLASPSWDIAIEIFDQNLVSDELWKISFKMKSFAPGVLTESFMFEMFDWDDSYENIFSSRFETHLFWLENTFLQLYTWKLQSYVDGSWWDQIPIGEDIRYRMQIHENTPRVFDWEISDFTSYIRSQDSESSFTLSWSLDDTNTWIVYFTGSMDTSLSSNEYSKIWLEISQNESSPIDIMYVLDGKKIQHKLSQTQENSVPVSLRKNVWTLINPVKIIWNLQWVWNTQNDFERQNMSDISSSTMRSALRKNINVAIRSRQHDTVVDGIKYIDASLLTNNLYILESNPTFETLIVHNWNIHINSDILSKPDMIGIVLYIDSGYSAQSWYEAIWNVYVDRDVSQIHASIYADGAMVSTNAGIPIWGSLSNRASQLQKQLYIKWALLTRNTLAGATLSDSRYMLPWGEYTTNQLLALQYDFHHIRRGANDCIEISGSCPFSEYFIIEYDPRINTNPPKLFPQ